MREQEVRELYEAYKQVHSQVEEVEQLDENVQDAVKGALEKGANFMKTNPVGKAVSKIIAPVGGGRKTPTATSGGYRKEEIDLFDTILEHLVAEGYADTNESALAIMANMSEEWKEDIMEISQKTAITAYARRSSNEFEGDDGPDRVRKNNELHGRIVKKFGDKSGEDANKAADANTFGRTDSRTGKRQPKPQSRFQNPNKYRTRADGKMHGQDQNKLKAKLQKRRPSDSDN
jgi:hypothetical protein